MQQHIEFVGLIGDSLIVNEDVLNLWRHFTFGATRMGELGGLSEMGYNSGIADNGAAYEDALRHGVQVGKVR